MLIAQKLAGYTLGGADLLRKAMGKKLADKMAKQQQTFVEGARAQGVAEADAERIFQLIAHFAGYGFNKSNAAAYGLLTYQPAYLKAHYPVEFLCGLLTADHGKIEKVVRIIAEGRAMGATILPPDINLSQTDFTVGTPRRKAISNRRADRKRRIGSGRRSGLVSAPCAASVTARSWPSSRRAPPGDRFTISSTSPAVSTPAASTRRRSSRSSSAAPSTRPSRRAASAVLGLRPPSIRSSGRAASRDRERGQTTPSLLENRAGDGEAPQKLDEYPPSDPWICATR
jgi:DNA polymerase-3 subunit alpha